MIDNITSGNVGSITVETQQNRGHPPEFWAEQLTNRICGISENAAPHVRQQAEAYRQAINSERCTMRNLLEQQGHEDLAKILKEI